MTTTRESSLAVLRSHRRRCVRLAIAPLAMVLANAPVHAAIIHVTPRDGVAPIARALARAHAGDTIRLAPGTYREPTLVVTTPVTLLGPRTAVLDGEGARALINVRANDVTVQGITLRHTGASGVDDRAALRFVEVARCRVHGVQVEQSFFGIYLARVTGCDVRDNVVRGNAGGEMDAGNGIHLWNARDVILVNNVVEHHRDGIYFEFTRASRAEHNTSQANSRYGLHFMFSDSCEYLRNRFVRNGAGIAVMYSAHVSIIGNEMADATGSAAYGLLLKAISDSRVDGNWFHDNAVALHLEDANRNQLTGNTFERNGWALRLMSNADDNSIRRNDFLRNAFDVSQTNERAGTTLADNYWDAYRGYDLDRNGVGDVPHRPVRLLAVVVERNPPALLLLRSLMLDLLERAERAFPVLTPARIQDATPRMRQHPRPRL
jgi:nitrous oxidase accessory protein